MRFLILADIHANWYALESVLADADGRYDEIVCCGDLVGYNPHPARVVEWTRIHCKSLVRGNHDKVVAGLEALEWFNDVARAAAVWTMQQLSPPAIGYLRDLPQGPLRLAHFHIWHGSPADEDEYVASVREAQPCFRAFDLPLAFFGHTHLQGGFFSKHGRVSTIARVPRNGRQSVLELAPEVLYMVNPGSVGQPRDSDPRAAYAIFDSDQRTATLHRVDYPIEKTAEDMLDAGLPEVLAARLFQGM